MATILTLTDNGGVNDLRAPDAGDIVLASDYNNMANISNQLTEAPTNVSHPTPAVSTIWGLNQGGTGEGQATAGVTLIDSQGTNGAMRDLMLEVKELQTFLGQTSETVNENNADTGDVITASDWAATARALEDCWDNRFGHTPSALSSGTSDTYTPTWGESGVNEILTATVTYTFSSAADCRAFFNGGGYLGVGDMSVTGTGHNADWDAALSAAGDVIVNHDSSTGTAVGVGFYDLSTTPTTLYTASLGGSYSGDVLTIQGSINSNSAPTVVTFTVELDDNGDNVTDELIDGDVTVTCRRRLPDVTGTTFTFATATENISFAVTT